MANSTLTGSMACPVCGVKGVHSHGKEDIQRWIQAQAGRFGYKAMVYTHGNPTDNLTTLAALKHERATGNRPGSKYELGLYPDDLIDAAIEVIEVQSAALATAHAAGRRAGLTEAEKIAERAKDIPVLDLYWHGFQQGCLAMADAIRAEKERAA